jgi:hypothetical protein
MTCLRLAITAGCLALVVGCLSGCGGGDEPAVDTDGGAASADPVQPGSGTLTTSVKPNSKLSVFFDSPLEIAADQSEVGTGGGGGSQPAPSDDDGDMGTAAAAPADDPPAAASGGGAVAWAELMPAELVESSVKNLRNELSTRLVNLGAYNSSFLEISVFGSALSFAAEIGRQHDGDIGWKKNAHLIRALGIAMVEVTGSSTARGKKSYDAVNDSFLTICEVLDGNDPAAPPEAEEEADISEAAEMAYLMKVIERQLEWMQNNVGNEDAFKEKAELAQREAALMATIGEAFNVEGYGYGAENDPEFTGFAYEFRDVAKAMSGAAKAGNFENFDLQRSQAAQKCVQCHMVYRNN